MKGLLSRNELEYRTPQQVSMTLEEIRGSRGITARYTVVSATRGDLWDFTSLDAAKTFALQMALEDRENGDWVEGRYTIRDNGMSREEFNAICDKWGLSLDTLAKTLGRSKECIRSYRYREGDALPAEIAAKVHRLDAELTQVAKSKTEEKNHQAKIKTYTFRVGGKRVERQATSKEKAAAELKRELLETLPKEYTSKHPLWVNALFDLDYAGEGSYRISQSWVLYWPNGADKPRAARRPRVY